ncbi:hypothetical protein SDC9_172173 [bioreactor metagenome]|uniref:Cell division protein ZapA n=1 Tax=bioreactor metagenome TaxID=1076179 RepID=A0A645GCY6_9ZZZZ|nr:cell division protein ZapA [Oscillospiraceae bacterium]
MKNRYEIDMSGVSLNVLADEDEAEFKDIVKTVDNSVREMMNINNRVTRIQATLLLCLDYRSRILTLEKENAALKEQLSLIADKKL